MISESVLMDAVTKLIQGSDYVARHQKLLYDIIEKNAWQEPGSFDVYQKTLFTYQNYSFDDLFIALRNFRNYQLLQLLLREFLGLATTQDTMRLWSDVADALILTAIEHCRRLYTTLHGEPLNRDGSAASLYPLSLGKLGGQELNFSSDIDLIFIYSESGQTQGPQSISNEEYYIKLIKKFVHLLQSHTKDGFVFRVDLRLRPFGSSGALAISLLAAETYYQEQGRDWERYAMLKARLIGQDSSYLFQRFITPFVYRRYVDFGAIESLRGMKLLIEREWIANPVLNDIKRGVGGIREIEFIIQCVQLIRGGRMKHLQISSSIKALDVLKQEGLLRWASLLKEAYLFYRKLENAIQTFSDRQTHTLPKDSREKDYVVCMMHYSSYSAMEHKRLKYQRIVRRLFCRILGEKRETENQQVANEREMLAQLWKGRMEESVAVNLLKNRGVVNPAEFYRQIDAFKHSSKCRRLSQVARLRLDRLMLYFLNTVASRRPTWSVLASMLQLFDQIINRSAYLSLLTENHFALNEVIDWFEKSPLIADWVVTHPFLLDVLIFRDVLWEPLGFVELKDALAKQLKNAVDQENQAEILREFKWMYWLKIACAELSGRCTSVRASRFLSDLATVVVTTVVDLATADLTNKHPEIQHIKSKFYLLAYGKLGSQEMSYHSDLDLVFLHHVGIDEEKHIFKLAQKILYMLTIRTRSGVLYSVDTRLRPSGSSGLLVSSVAAFIEYQFKQAWTWEHQALLKARILIGDSEIKRQFLALKKRVFTREVDPFGRFQEIQNMRLRMQHHHLEDHTTFRSSIEVEERQRDIKYAPGGLLDLEFLTQYLVLTTPHPIWCRVTNTGRQIGHLQQLGRLTSSECHRLQRAYVAFHQALHELALLGKPVSLSCHVDVGAIYAIKTPSKS